MNELVNDRVLGIIRERNQRRGKENKKYMRKSEGVTECKRKCEKERKKEEGKSV